MFGRVVLDMIVVDGERSIILRSGPLRSRDANNTFTCMSSSSTNFGNTSTVLYRIEMSLKYEKPRKIQRSCMGRKVPPPQTKEED